jgi:hypothetical protein
MKGGFICPYCKTSNACDCAACKEFIQEGEYVNKWTEDGEGLICGKCAKVYSPDQSLEDGWFIVSVTAQHISTGGGSHLRGGYLIVFERTIS